MTTARLYTHGMKVMLNADLDVDLADKVKMMLIHPSADTTIDISDAAHTDHEFLSEFNGGAGMTGIEFDGASTRVSLTITDAVNDTTNKTTITPANHTYTSLAAGTYGVEGVLVYFEGGATDAARTPICFIPFDANRTPNGTDFQVQFNGAILSWAQSAQTIFHYGTQQIINGGIDPDTDELKGVLIMDSASTGIDLTTDGNRDAQTLSALNGGGGLAGAEFDGSPSRFVIDNCTVTADEAGNLTVLDGDDEVLTALSAGTYDFLHVLVYASKNADNDANNVPLFMISFGQGRQGTGADFTVVWHVDGMLQWNPAA